MVNQLRWLHKSNLVKPFTTVTVFKIVACLLHAIKNHPFKCILLWVLKNIEFCNSPVKMKNTCTPSQTLCAPCSIPLLHSTFGKHWSVLCPYSFTSSRMSHYVLPFEWGFFRLAVCLRDSSMSCVYYCWFLLLLNSITLCECLLICS